MGWPLAGIAGRLAFVDIVGGVGSGVASTWGTTGLVVLARGARVVRRTRRGITPVVSAPLRVTGVSNVLTVGLDGGEGVIDGRGDDDGVLYGGDGGTSSDDSDARWGIGRPIRDLGWLSRSKELPW